MQEPSTLQIVPADVKSQLDIMYMQFVGVTSAEAHWQSKLKLVFVGDLYLLSNRTPHFYSKTNQMHQCLKLILFGVTLHVSDGLSVHRQAFKDCTYSNKHMSNRYC